MAAHCFPNQASGFSGVWLNGCTCTEYVYIHTTDRVRARCCIACQTPEGPPAVSVDYLHYPPYRVSSIEGGGNLSNFQCVRRHFHKVCGSPRIAKPVSTQHRQGIACGNSTNGSSRKGLLMRCESLWSVHRADGVVLCRGIHSSIPTCPTLHPPLSLLFCCSQILRPSLPTYLPTLPTFAQQKEEEEK